MRESGWRSGRKGGGAGGRGVEAGGKDVEGGRKGLERREKWTGHAGGRGEESRRHVW